MKLGIMQPYFFPYIGYFQLINAVDKFILFDVVQFIRHGWIERNRILKQNNDWLYVKVPLNKPKRETKINDLTIRTEDWKNKIIAQLQVYKKRAPYFNSVLSIISESIAYKTDSIVKLNEHIINKINGYLKIETPVFVFSEMDLKIEQVNDAGEWALNISKAINANTYINPIGGQEIFDREKFERNKIELKFLQTGGIIYNQFNESFIPHLSIIDVMMFNSAEEIRKMLTNYKLI